MAKWQGGELQPRRPLFDSGWDLQRLPNYHTNTPTWLNPNRRQPMSKQEIVELADTLISPVLNIVEFNDPGGFTKWREAVIVRLTKEFAK
jgi:hypothetical protein